MEAEERGHLVFFLFQTLIGTVKSTPETAAAVRAKAFQTLIGTVKRKPKVDWRSVLRAFQTLIGTVKSSPPGSPTSPLTARFKPS